MQSDWCETGYRQRHIIVVFTDGSATALETGKHLPGVPADLRSLEEWWENGVPGGNLKVNIRRMVILAPDMYPWNLMGIWNAVYHKPLIAGKGLNEIDWDAVEKFVVAGHFFAYHYSG